MSSKKISIFPELMSPVGLEHTVIEYGNANYKIKLNTIAALVTKSTVGLSNVNNTSDMDKPVSTATGIALAGKANLSHTHTGYANIDSPAFTGLPTAPTASPGTSTTQIATTAFVMAASGGGGDIPNASTTVAGKVELATGAETVTGTDDTRAVTPLGLTSVTSTLAQQAEMNSRFGSVDTQFTAVYEHVSTVRGGLEQTDAETIVYIEDTRDTLRTETTTAIEGVNLSITTLTNNVSSEINDVNDRINTVEQTVDTNRTTVAIDNIVTLTVTLVVASAGRVTRFSADGAKVLNVDSATGHTVNEIYHVSNRAASGNLTLTPVGTMVLNAPKGGALVLEPGDTVSLHCVSANVMDVYGSTLAA